MFGWIKGAAKWTWKHRLGIGTLVYFLVSPHVSQNVRKQLDAGKTALDASRDL